jgi:hypothetical protein
VLLVLLEVAFLFYELPLGDILVGGLVHLSAEYQLVFLPIAKNFSFDDVLIPQFALANVVDRGDELLDVGVLGVEHVSVENLEVL